MALQAGLALKVEKGPRAESNSIVSCFSVPSPQTKGPSGLVWGPGLMQRMDGT